jgi:transcription antitermination factor NusG
VILSGPEAETNKVLPWSILYVAPNHEKRVAERLAVHSFEYYLPLYKEQSRWTDRTVQLARPLFLNYVFVRFAPSTRHTLLAFPSVLHLLGDGKQEMVSAAEIDRIREALANGYVLRPYADVAVGTRVRIIRGIFAGAKGIVRRFYKRCRVVMTIEATQQRFSVETDLDDLEILREPIQFGKV